MRITRLHTRLFILVAAMGLSPAWSDEVEMPTSTPTSAPADSRTPART